MIKLAETCWTILNGYYNQWSPGRKEKREERKKNHIFFEETMDKNFLNSVKTLT